MERKLISTAINAFGNDSLATPYLDLAVWPDIAGKFEAFGCLPFPVPMCFANSTTQNFAQFEKQAFQVIGFTCEWLSSPSSELDDFKRAFRRRNQRFIDAWGPDYISGCHRISIDDSRNHFQPFDACTTHEAAAKGCLSLTFLKQVGRLFNKTGPRSVLMWTGGSAPFDFIQVQVVDVAAKKLRIALGDAKHRSTTTAGTRCQADVVADAKEFGKKAPAWFEGMKRELEELEYPVDSSYTVSLITNVAMPDDIRCGVVCDNGLRVLILGPSNFTFKPWTDLLYRC
jgi:hypothetical protein